MSNSILFWILFNLLVLGIMTIDLKIIHRHAHVIFMKEASLWFGFLVVLALVFDVGIYFFLGHEKALQFLTGYVIEQSLSIDNLFVFLMIFDYFSVPAIYQPRVLHWGILGALVMRFIMIFAGTALLHKFHWMIYLFGGILIFTGIKTAFSEDKKIEPEKNPLLKFFKKIMPIASREFVDQKFFIKLNGILHATPLFVVLLLIESSDVVFAIDSIPAVLAVSRDPFIVYTSNVFAILGLRTLYFLLSGIMPLFTYLKFGISIVLFYVGVKMILVDIYKIPTGLSLGIVAGILSLSIVASYLFKGKVPTPQEPASKKYE
ncbi:MAG: TerC family protein [Elusimicrobia bacterium]|nr:TerC family protein [Elusimicrobiota bacterium]